MAINLGTVTNASDTTPWLPVGPGTFTAVVRGTFDSGTVVIQATDNDGADVLDGGAECSFTADSFRTLEIGEGMKLRATISGEGASADVDVILRPLKAR